MPYTLRTVGFPTDVVARREGNDLVVEWTQPSDGAPSMLGKVLLFPDGGEIRRRRAASDSVRKIARALGVGNATIGESLAVTVRRVLRAGLEALKLGRS